MSLCRVLTTGSRVCDDPQPVEDSLLETWHDALQNDFTGLIVVHGACQDRRGRLTGVDGIASRWARAHERYGITEEAHPADKFGPWPACGPIRNQRMVNLGADICLAHIGPCTSSRCHRSDPHGSHGATGCTNLAEKAGIPVRRYTA